MKKTCFSSAWPISSRRYWYVLLFLVIFAYAGAPLAAQSDTTILHIPAWAYPGELNIDSADLVGQPIPIDSSYVIQEGPELMGISWTDEVFANCGGFESIRLRRERFCYDWFNFDPDAPVLDLPLLDLNSDGLVGDGYDIAFFGDSVWLYANGQLVTPLLPRTNGAYRYVQNAWINADRMVYGRVFIDSLANCTFDAVEKPGRQWTVTGVGQPSGQVYTTQTEPGGYYFLAPCTDDTAVEISLAVSFNYGQDCPTTYAVALTPGTVSEQNVPVKLEGRCPLMSIDIGTGRVRPCFLDAYTVSYCNESALSIANAYVEVTLDPYLSFASSSIPGGLLSGNTYAFGLGTLAPGYCGSFKVFYTASCDLPAEGGTTHCSEAHIFPDSLCEENTGWSGAWLRATGFCDGDSVRLAVENIGQEPMAGPLELVIVEDLVMYMTTPFQLDPGQTLSVGTPANGATWRIEAPQETAHPWSGTVSAFVEGCGGLNESGTGLAFPLDNSNPFAATDCTISTNSWDPNDKQAVPIGYGAAHFVRPNTELDYKIRFQNTGSDTAYTVVILDTLSAHLDAATLVPGASSHHYDFDLLPGNVLRFRFDDIDLVDSNTNEPLSHGFVKYRVQQQPDLPDYTEIHNRAGIYFDFNDPVITNTTLHTVKADFIEVSDVQSPGQAGVLRVFPNPAAADVRFEWAPAVDDAQFVLTDALGRTVRTAHIGGTFYRFERGGLAPGVFWFSIRSSAGALYTGKITLR